MSVSAETPKPQPGDKARFTYVAEVYEMGDSPKFVKWAKSGDMVVAVPADATVEVLERADDPSKDKPGAYRTAHRDGATLVKLRDNHWAAPREGECTPLYYSDADMAEIAGPLIGVLPGTPAAEATESSARLSVRVQNEPHGPNLQARRLMVDLVAVGRLDAAVNVATTAGMDPAAARAYVVDLAGGGDRTEVDPTEADRMRAMGFDQQPDLKVSDDDRALIESVLQDRMGEYFRASGDGYRLNTTDLSGVVADIVFAAIRRDRERRPS